jgi:hypothetical protein
MMRILAHPGEKWVCQKGRDVTGEGEISQDEKN